MIKAKTVVTNKFWILQNQGRKVGELNLEQEGYRVKTVRGTQLFKDIKSLDIEFRSAKSSAFFI